VTVRTALAATAMMGAGLLAVGYAVSSGAVGSGAAGEPPRAEAPAPSAGAAGRGVNDPLGRDITRLQAVVRDRPTDAGSLAVLGLDYVQQAKITVDPSYYPKAEQVLAQSLRIQPNANFKAMAGKAALKAAQHDFAGARDWARRGLAVDPYSATLYGSLTDAETQLANYPAAFRAAQRMLDLRPGVPSLTRGAYVFELRGQLPQARAVLGRALAAATAPSDIAFIHQISSELAMGQGDPTTALREATAGLTADPGYSSLLQSKAKAEAALGRTDDAVRDYDAVVTSVPQPQYVVEYGEYLDSLGRHPQARQQYALFEAENKLFTSNGVTLDTDPTLFYADHGSPALALRYGRAGLRIRPFQEMEDAYAWALHVNGRDAEALGHVRKAAALGTRNALFAYHAGVIENALGNKNAAKASLRRALAIDPHFSPLHVPRARALLARLK